MDSRLQIVAIVCAFALVLLVLEMVRRRRLMERYALLWMFASVVVLGLAVWEDGLNTIARAMGIASPPNALFFIAVAFILLLLLHFSAAMSRLADQSKVLAQRQAILEHRIHELEAERTRAAGRERARALVSALAPSARGAPQDRVQRVLDSRGNGPGAPPPPVRRAAGRAQVRLAGELGPAVVQRSVRGAGRRYQWR